MEDTPESTAPCPFCKLATHVLAAEDFWGNVYYRVECIEGANCDGRSGFRGNRQMAIDHWNHLLTGSPPPDYTK
jgi:hypothetical protein